MKLHICVLLCFLALAMAEDNRDVESVVTQVENSGLQPVTRNKRLIGGVGIVAGVGIGGIKGTECRIPLRLVR